MPKISAQPDIASSGIAGLDDVLRGGFVRERLYLVEGSPGAGKTTMALQFLMEGAAAKERCLYISLSETEIELRESAASHGWVLPPEIEVFELIPPETLLDADQRQSLLYSSDLELGETTKILFEQVEKINPKRIVIDSLSEIRLLAQSSLRYRRQILALKHFFSSRGSTVLLLDDLTSEATDKTVHSIVHGVIHLEQLVPMYGAERRRLRVIKYRGVAFRGGYHDMKITTGGTRIFPRLIAAEHRRAFDRDLIKTGISGIDSLLGGGIEPGMTTLLLGPSGSGKSLMAAQFTQFALSRGEKAAFFAFDESTEMLKERVSQIGMDFEKPVNDKLLTLDQIDPAETSPGEFAHRVRGYVEQGGVRTVVIDSLNGYQAAMPEEQFLLLHMHELLSYLNAQGVSTFITIAQHGLLGDMSTPIDITYLSDAVLLLRYFEAKGRLRRALSVVKKRTGEHENTIRELEIGAGGIGVSEPLTDMQGILRGVPDFVAGQSSGDDR